MSQKNEDRKQNNAFIESNQFHNAIMRQITESAPLTMPCRGVTAHLPPDSGFAELVPDSGFAELVPDETLAVAAAVASTTLAYNPRAK